jgi:hypothetical protein
MMKKILIMTFVLVGAMASSLYAAEKEQKNKILLFLDPSETTIGGIFEFVQYWTWHPDIDATLVMKDLPQDALDDFKKRVMASDDDDPVENARLDRWFDQEELIEKAGYTEKIRTFLKDYAQMEFKNISEPERVESRPEPIMDQGNRLAKKFRVTSHPSLIVVDVKTKRVTRYPLPGKFYQAVKDLDYLLNVNAKDLFEDQASSE